MWYVYVLLCEDGSFYTGSSNDVTKRFVTHQTGKGSKYTRSHKPIKILHTEAFETKSEALKREYLIKSWDRSKKITELKLGKT
jgi:putative endonuclease